MIVLNKTDLSTPEKLDETERQLARLNNVAPIERAKNSDIDLGRIFNLGEIDFTQKLDSHDHDSDDGHGRAHHHHHPHNHLQNIETACVERAGELDGLKVSIWFRSIIGEMGDKLLRMKGILNLKSEMRRRVVHSNGP